VNKSSEQQIVPGISVTSAGEASVDSSLTGVLFELAGQLEGPTNLPVDVEHVLAAIVLAVRAGEIESTKPLSGEDPAVVATLVDHVKTVFEQFGGNVGRED